jgi:hypothetical protein
VRAASGPRRGDPIVMGFFEAFEGPGSGLEAGVPFGRFFKSVGPVRAACFRFDHEGSLPDVHLRRDFIRPGTRRADLYSCCSK